MSARRLFSTFDHPSSTSDHCFSTFDHPSSTSGQSSSKSGSTYGQPSSKFGHSSGATGLTRRSTLLLCAGGAVSLAGCLSGNGADDGLDEQTGTLVVEATSAVEESVRVQVALIEGDASFEESVLGTTTLEVSGDSVHSTYDDVRGGPFRVVVRVEGGWEDFETTWDLSECVELGLFPTVREDEVSVTRTCTHPPGTTPAE